MKSLVKLLSLMMVLALLLTGCNLFVIDEYMQLEDDYQALKDEFSVPLAQYDGGEVTKFEIMEAFYATYSFYNSMSTYSSDYSLNSSDYTELAQQFTRERAQNEIARIKAETEYGISLTDEEISDLEATALSDYNDYYEEYKTYSSSSDPDTIELNTEYLLYSAGISLDQQIDKQITTAIVDKLREVIDADITEADEEDIKEAYNEKVDSDEATYSVDLKSFEEDMSSGETNIYWMPSGYRTVYRINLSVDEELLSTLKDAQDALENAKSQMSDLEDEYASVTAEDASEDEAARTPDEIQAEIDALNSSITQLNADVEAAAKACADSVRDVTEEIYSRLDSGETFEAVMADYDGSDEIYVSADSEYWDSAVVESAMALNAVGDYASEPVATSDGVVIVGYASDVTPGEIGLDNVYDEVYDSVLAELRDTNWTQVLNQWTTDYNVHYLIEDNWSFEG